MTFKEQNGSLCYVQLLSLLHAAKRARIRAILACFFRRDAQRATYHGGIIARNDEIRVKFRW